ncbi:MAG TPA: hypothetical protein VK668_17060 [Mucilaginibacter sp.]|nr:hypothetical protein [Mucilaginibacter sp.]
MKRLLTLCLFALLTYSASAQTNDPKPYEHTKDAVKAIGQDVAIADTVSGYKVIGNDMTLLDLGGKHPNQVITVVMKGTDITLKPADLVGKRLYVKGKVILYKDKPEIVVTDPKCIYLFADYK